MNGQGRSDLLRPFLLFCGSLSRCRCRGSACSFVDAGAGTIIGRSAPLRTLLKSGLGRGQSSSVGRWGAARGRRKHEEDDVCGRADRLSRGRDGAREPSGCESQRDRKFHSNVCERNWWQQVFQNATDSAGVSRKLPVFADSAQCAGGKLLLYAARLRMYQTNFIAGVSVCGRGSRSFRSRMCTASTSATFNPFAEVGPAAVLFLTGARVLDDLAGYEAVSTGIGAMFGAGHRV